LAKKGCASGSYLSDFPTDSAVLETIKNINRNITKEYAKSHNVVLFAIFNGAITKNVNTAAAIVYANNILEAFFINVFILQSLLLFRFLLFMSPDKKIYNNTCCG
jgi:hypothetical protein